MAEDLIPTVHDKIFTTLYYNKMTALPDIVAHPEKKPGRFERVMFSDKVF